MELQYSRHKQKHSYSQHVPAVQQATKILKYLSLHPGHAFPLTCSATGKAIVAFLPEKEREKLLAEEPLFFYEEPASLDREKLAREFDECRHTGYAEAPGKVSPLVRITASPVLGRKGSPIGAIFIVGIFPKTSVPSYGNKVAEAARRVSSVLGSDAT